MEGESQITAGKLADMVRAIISGGNPKPEVVPSRRQALLAVQQARNRVVSDFVWALHREEERTIPFELIDEKEVKLLDYKDGVKRVSLESRVLSGLPRNVGIVSLTTVDMPPVEVIPAPTNFMTLYQNLDSFDMGGEPFFVPVKDNLYVYNIDGNCDLLLRAIFAGQEYGEREFFCITPEMEKDVIDIALSMLMPMREIPEDAITDNTKR